IDRLGDRRAPVELAYQVDPVDQRSTQPARVAGAVPGRALAIVLPACAGAAVARADEHHVGRVDDRSLPAGDCDAALLERLSQRLERGPRELRELVEEEHPAVGQRYLAGPWSGAASDEAR